MIRPYHTSLRHDSPQSAYHDNRPHEISPRARTRPNRTGHGSCHPKKISGAIRSMCANNVEDMVIRDKAFGTDTAELVRRWPVMRLCLISMRVWNLYKDVRNTSLDFIIIKHKFKIFTQNKSHYSTLTSPLLQIPFTLNTMPSTTKTSQAARLQNDFGADYWVRKPEEEHRVCSSWTKTPSTKHTNIAIAPYCRTRSFRWSSRHKALQRRIRLGSPQVYFRVEWNSGIALGPVRFSFEDSVQELWLT